MRPSALRIAFAFGIGDGGDGVPRAVHGVENHDAHHGIGRGHGMG